MGMDATQEFMQPLNAHEMACDDVVMTCEATMISRSS